MHALLGLTSSRLPAQLPARRSEAGVHVKKTSLLTFYLLTTSVFRMIALKFPIRSEDIERAVQLAPSSCKINRFLLAVTSQAPNNTELAEPCARLFYDDLELCGVDLAGEGLGTANERLMVT